MNLIIFVNWKWLLKCNEENVLYNIELASIISKHARKSTRSQQKKYQEQSTDNKYMHVHNRDQE